MYVLDGFIARQHVSELQTVRSCLLTSSDDPSSGQVLFRSYKIQFSYHEIVDFSDCVLLDSTFSVSSDTTCISFVLLVDLFQNDYFLGNRLVVIVTRTYTILERNTETNYVSVENCMCDSKSTAMETPPESMPTEWTDEKHSMYLKSMEASFVNDLYDSMEFLGWCPEKKDILLSKTSNQTRPKPSSPSGQVSPH